MEYSSKIPEDGYCLSIPFASHSNCLKYFNESRKTSTVMFDFFSNFKQCIKRNSSLIYFKLSKKLLNVF